MPSDDDRDHRADAPYYGKARIWAGLGCFAIAGAVFLLDVFLNRSNIVELGLFLGTGTLLLGVEGFRKLLG